MSPNNETRSWVQFPLKKTEAASQGNYVIEQDFDQSPVGKTVVRVIPSGNNQEISLVPVLPGYIAFQPVSLTGIDLDNLQGLKGTIHLLIDRLVFRELKENLQSLHSNASVPSNVFYENAELDNATIQVIDDRLSSLDVQKDGQLITDIRQKTELFLKGEIRIRIEKDDQIGRISKTVSDEYPLTITFGRKKRSLSIAQLVGLYQLEGFDPVNPQNPLQGTLDLSGPYPVIRDVLYQNGDPVEDGYRPVIIYKTTTDATAPDRILYGTYAVKDGEIALKLGPILFHGFSELSLTPTDILNFRPLPMGHFYKIVKDSAPELFANNHDSHPLFDVLIGSPPVLWTRVSISKVGAMSIYPSPQPGIEEYSLKILQGGTTTHFPLPISGTTYIRRRSGDVTLSVERQSDSSVIPIRERDILADDPFDYSNFENSKTISNDQAGIELEHISTLGTYGVISLGTRKDAVTFMKKLEDLGLSPITEPARYKSAAHPPSRAKIEGVLKSSPDWLYLGGHFLLYLYNWDNSISLEFKEDKIEITHPDGNINLSKGSDLKFHEKLKVIVFGGCSLLGQNSNYELTNLAKLTKSSGKYPTFLGWRCTTGRELIDRFLGGTKSPLRKTGEDFFSRIGALYLFANAPSPDWLKREAKKAWLDTAIAYSKKQPPEGRWLPGRAAAMDENGKTWGFVTRTNNECARTAGTYDFSVPPVELRSV